MIFYPNAKINLGLNVFEKRIDGYHEISSIFYPVKQLFDILEVIPSDVFSNSTSGLIIPGKENICERAFKLLELDFGISPVKIYLHKQIPIGAGLGGGSADGAFTLIALNKLFDLKLSKEELEKYALQLGADTPFFIENKPKYVTGIGDKMIPVNLDLSTFEIKFIFSNLHISTVEAYSGIKPKLSTTNLLTLINQPLDRWKGEVRNDFEKTIFSKYPELEIIKKKLYTDGAIYASMSGTGSALYGIFSL